MSSTHLEDTLRAPGQATAAFVPAGDFRVATKGCSAESVVRLERAPQDDEQGWSAWLPPISVDHEEVIVGGRGYRYRAVANAIKPLGEVVISFDSIGNLR